MREGEDGMISLVQFRGAGDDGGVAVIRDGGAASRLPGVSSTLALARRALAEGTTLDALTRAIGDAPPVRSEEHTSELQSLMRISYAVFCLKKKKTQTRPQKLTQD